MGYSYDRTKKAARVPTLTAMLSKWLEAVANAVAKEIPTGLKVDSIRVNANQRNFALLEAKGYSRSDFEATTSVSFTVDYSPFRLRAFAEYRDVMMGTGRGAEEEFTLQADEDPTKLAKDIARWLANR